MKNIADPCIGKVYLRDSENGSSFTIQGADRYTDESVFTMARRIRRGIRV
ncbi:MAG: hypothetical protein ACLTDF_04705 [Coprococcus sp.]